jgi:hypothetical protein
MLDAKRQAAYATDTAVGPANIKALDLLDPKTKEPLPSYHYQKGELVAVTSAWWAATLDKVTERWSLDLLHCTTHCLVAEWAVGALLTGS